MRPDAATRLCAVIGHPVAHSLSPTIHNAALRHDGRNAVYLAFDVEDAEPAIHALRGLGAVGVNVTLPHKRAALRAAPMHSETAERIGAANTLVFDGDTITAHNTDGEGIIRALEDLGAAPHAKPCLVIGAGGAARAAVWALGGAGASEVVVCNRTDERAVELGTDLGARTVPWTNLDAAVASAEIVVHATSVGLEGGRSLLSEETLGRAAAAGCRALLDLVYGHTETDLVERARAAGMNAGDGLGVLVHQAAVAYRLFWDADAPAGVMREAAWQAAGRTSPMGIATPPA